MIYYGLNLTTVMILIKGPPPMQSYQNIKCERLPNISPTETVHVYSYTITIWSDLHNTHLSSLIIDIINMSHKFMITLQCNHCQHDEQRHQKKVEMSENSQGREPHNEIWLLCNLDASRLREIPVSSTFFIHAILKLPLQGIFKGPLQCDLIE